MTRTAVSAKTLPVVELFGPTVQGEGPQAGRPAYFVRLGGCDYRCSWCDSMYAVNPAEVRANAEPMTASAIREAVAALPEGPTLVVLTGGNPALHPLDDLVDELHAAGHEVAVETQGSVYRPWLGRVEQLVVSPKPPSSGEASDHNWWQLERFMGVALVAAAPIALKVVVFDDADLEFARRVARAWPAVPLHLSVGTDPVPSADDDADVRAILNRYRWLCESAADDPELTGARVLPQLHVLIWGRRRGV